MKTGKLKKTAALILAFLIVSMPLSSLALEIIDGIGQLIQSSTLEIGAGTYFTRNILRHTSLGIERENYIEFSPSSAAAPVIAYGSKLYGKSTVKTVAAYLAEQGENVIAAINADFYMTDTGIPIGLVVTDGIIRSSDAGANAVGFRADGTAFVGTPKLSIKADIGGIPVTLDYINKSRKYYGLYLFTSDYSATTRSTAEAKSVIIGGISGNLTVGGTVTGTVESVVQSTDLISLPENKMVISAEALQYYRLEGVEAGMPVTITVTAGDSRFGEAVSAVGGGVQLLKDGVITSGLEAGSAPRTALGVKADGSYVLYTVDGRQTGYSNGMTLTALAQRMQSLGCVNAINLDGGGSTAMVVTYPGDAYLKTANSPSDGSLRSCSNFIFLVSNLEKTGILGHLQIYPYDIRILRGASTELSVGATDTNYFAMSAPSGLSYSLSSAGLGRVSGTTLTGQEAGAGTLTVSGGGVSGSTGLKVVETPTGIGFYDEGTGKTVTALQVSEGQSVNLQAQAYLDGAEVISDDGCFNWAVSGQIGTVSAEGVFTAENVTQNNGKIFVSCGDFTASIDVMVSTEPILALDFETSKTYASGADVALATQNDRQYVRYGASSAKLTYDFERTAATTLAAPLSYTFQSSPAYINAWVCGDGSGNDLYLRFATPSGNQAIKMCTLDFTGYRLTKTPVPSGATGFSALAVVRPGGGRASGIVYIDQIMEVYKDMQDTVPPVISISQSAMNDAGTISLTAVITDADAGVTEGGINLTLDGQDRAFSFNEDTGTLTATVTVSDMARTHRLTVTAMDVCGNLSRSAKEYKSIGTPSPFADTASHWAGGYADYLYHLGIVTGSASGGRTCFYPDDNITRLEFAVMMARYLRVEADAYSDVELPFSDAQSIPGWALDSVKAVYSLGIVKGRTSAGGVVFAPQGNLTRAEIMTMIGRTMDKGYAQATLGYSDSAAVPSYARDYISVMVNLKILNGYTDNTLRPGNFLTRGEAAKILYMMY